MREQTKNGCEIPYHKMPKGIWQGIVSPGVTSLSKSDLESRWSP